MSKMASMDSPLRGPPPDYHGNYVTNYHGTMSLIIPNVH